LQSTFNSAARHNEKMGVGDFCRKYYKMETKLDNFLLIFGYIF